MQSRSSDLNTHGRANAARCYCARGASHSIIPQSTLVTKNDTVLIIGFGGVCLNAVQVAQHLGAKRISVDDNQQSVLDVAARLGIVKEDAFRTAVPGARPLHVMLADRRILPHIVPIV